MTSVTKLLNDPYMVEAWPAWGPLGTKLLYVRFFDQNSRNRHFQLVIRDLLTTTDTIIADSTKQAIFYPDWNHAPNLNNSQ